MVARFADGVARRYIPKKHRYHSFPESKKIGIATQIAMLPARVPIYLAFVPLVGLGVDGYTDWHSILLDDICTLYITTYFFDAAHRSTSIPLELLLHHFIAAITILWTTYLRAYVSTQEHVAFTLLFVPFLSPGVALGDTCIDLASLTYSLSPTSPKALLAICATWILATSHLLIRLIQWYTILSHAHLYRSDLMRFLGIWAWVLPPMLGFWATMEFADAYVLFLFPGKLVRRQRAAQGERGEGEVQLKEEEKKGV
ncbi:hypothetical protein VNI00_005441 [Paramarasmius palmivorus]|uniref:TLC domain-containing protein n=1 Tax=Paramarasmius palmivorus TaxID=297713 RepID=A0AAW0DBQ1_9AGAR